MTKLKLTNPGRILLVGDAEPDMAMRNQFASSTFQLFIPFFFYLIFLFPAESKLLLFPIQYRKQQ